MKISPDWIALDWGTSNLRVWAMTSGGEILDSAQSGEGMASLSRSGFEPALLRLIEPWLFENKTIPVTGCGMVGAKQGWQEVPYAAVPCSPMTESTAVSTRDNRIEVTIRAGVQQKSPADVMRGEETQIAGFLTTRPDYEGVICLPGTHSKWVEIDDGKVQQFQTFMTGELFALLAEKSVLRHSVESTHFDDTAFLEAFGKAHRKPAQFSAGLFTLRAEGLLSGLHAGTARSRLSGALIGLEFAGARHFWEAHSEVTIIGATTLTSSYESAFNSLNIDTHHIPVGQATLAGLSAEA